MKRIGADPPKAEVTLLERSSLAVLTACGVPSSLFAESEGTAQRELLHSTIHPLGRLVADELSAKFETDVTLSFDGLFAADLLARPRVESRAEARASSRQLSARHSPRSCAS